MKKGFTLIEILVVLFTLPIILTLSIGVIRVLSEDVESEDRQMEVFLLQYEYLMQTVANIRYDKQVVSYTFNGQEYKLIHDRNRFVKTPGYEILLYDVEALEYQEGCLSLMYKGRWHCLEI